jgi:DNA polymerase-1
LIRQNGDLPAVLQALDESELIGLDCETTGLDPRTDRVRLLSLATDRGCYLIDAFDVDVRPLFPALAEKPFVAHHAAFDGSFLTALGFTPGPVRDTMLLSQLLYAGRHESHKLADCSERELGKPLDKTMQKSDWGRALSPAQLGYAAADAAVLVPLYQRLDAKVREAGMADVADIEHRCLPALVWLAQSGVLFDADAWQALAEGANEDSLRLAKELDDAAPPPAQLGMFSGWNWDSPEQVKQAFAAVGCPIDATDDDTLAKVDHPLAALMRQYREVRKRCTTYGRDWMQYVAPDGRVYAGWRQIGASSGRMSCSSPNLQQLPRGTYRSCFRAPDGRVLVKADYSQIELRIAAKVSGDKAMLDAYRQGLDLHTLTAQRLLGKEQVTKEDRQIAKSANFGLLYGMGWKGYQDYAKSNYGVELTAGQAQRYREMFFRAYPGLAAWHNRVRHHHAPETRTLAGRRRLLDADAFDTVRLNSPIQGTGADGLKRALALCWERRADVPGAFPVLIVHDEIVVECGAGQAEDVGAWLKQAMCDGIAEWLDPVPIEIEVSTAPTWGG